MLQKMQAMAPALTPHATPTFAGSIGSSQAVRLQLVVIVTKAKPAALLAPVKIASRANDALKDARNLFLVKDEGLIGAGFWKTAHR